ncbi:hypothetical protein [Cellulomonas aerilata]|uniref:Uncharacterized protein n=1 Tax=Cellulomonas aerilata TaxID=515326 RepID=A0A512DB04_9CELL|nr:hypothetical protein [Cellulomonas aerilata]GEO33635.1 hypothetical protein CAE01nite_13600 [Cellulomonas aerilata]
MAGPTDWVSGERVFAPPKGVLDVDWLVPALLEALPGVTPAEARSALAAAWTDHRSARVPDRGDPLRARAADVVAAAVQAFGA